MTARALFCLSLAFAAGCGGRTLVDDSATSDGGSAGNGGGAVGGSVGGGIGGLPGGAGASGRASCGGGFGGRIQLCQTDAERQSGQPCQDTPFGRKICGRPRRRCLGPTPGEVLALAFDERRVLAQPDDPG